MKRFLPRLLELISLPPGTAMLAVVFLAVGSPNLLARPADPAKPSFGYFAASDPLSELNDYLRTEGVVTKVAGGRQWPRFVERVANELPTELAPFRTSAVTPSKADAQNEISRLVREAQAKNPSVPQLLWAGMLREGVGVARNPKEALAEFLRVAAVEGESDQVRARAKFALREAVVTRLLFAGETGDSQDLRDAVGAAVGQDVTGAYYWMALLSRYEKLTAKVEYHQYGNIDGLVDGAAAGDLFCGAAQASNDAVEAGLPAAQYNRALVEEGDQTGPSNEPEARRLYGLAADAGMADAQRRLAEMLAEGRGGSADLPEALRRMRLAAAQDGMAGYLLGSVLCTGEWGERNPHEGLEHLAVATTRGVWPAGLQRAWFLHLGLAGGPSDDAAAKKSLVAAGEFAGVGKNAAQMAIGLALWNGVVVPPARNEAPKYWLSVPDDQLSAVVVVHLATAYRVGGGVAVDLKQASSYAERALQAGLSVAALELAEIRLLQQKEREAITYFRRAADGGSAQALSRLADCAAKGVGGPPQPALATRLREQARMLRTRGSADL